MGDGKGDAPGQYGSQWFITLGDCRAELDGKCTMFGRIEGDGIYNVMKIANGEVIEGTERPVYPEKILSVEVLEMPEGEAWKVVRKREKIAQRTTDSNQKETGKKSKTVAKKKGGKTLLSFAGDGGDEDGADIVVRPKKAKFNTALIDSPAEPTPTTKTTSQKSTTDPPNSKKRKSPDPTPSRKSPEPTSKRRKPSFHESTTQLPIRDPESPSRSPTPDLPQPTIRRHSSNHKSASALEAEIAALKATMKRDTAAPAEPKKKLSALEALIPATSTRGRKRPRPGEGTAAADDNSSLKLLNAFKARLEGATQTQMQSHSTTEKQPQPAPSQNGTSNQPRNTDDTADEAPLCDLHFIANCQSCSDWIEPDPSNPDQPSATNNDPEDNDPASFLSHSLTFEKDRLGKDLTWKRKNEEELVVIDPRERERELGIKSGRERERDRDRGKGTGREWDGDLGVGKGKGREREKGGDRRR